MSDAAAGDVDDGQDAAPANPLERLLVVQAHDTTADQLRHRLGGLPEQAELDVVIARIRALDTETASVAERRDGLARELKRLEDEVATIEARTADTDAKLYGGAVSAARELQALQDELKSLKRRQNSLEDDELELMEQVEPLDAELARLGAERATADDEGTRLTAAVAEAQVAITAELEAIETQRAAAVDGVAAPLLDEYERLRGQLGGIAVARLEAKTCGGCHLGLSAVEVDRIRKSPAGEIVHCEECGRILVH